MNENSVKWTQADEVNVALEIADTGDRTTNDPLWVLASEVRRLRDILINPAQLRGHVTRQFPEYAWEHVEFFGRLRADAA